MKYSLMLICIILLISGCDSQENRPKGSTEHKIDLKEYCKTHECRKDLKFTLKRPDESYLNFHYELYLPVVQEAINKSASDNEKKNYLVNIFPGETIHIAFDPGADGPENLRSVSDTDSSENILTFRLTQEENIADGCGMKLDITNSSGYYIKYWLFLQKIEDKKPDKVASCPLKPESNSYETWQHPVFQLSMGKFQWADESDMECN